MKKKITSYLKLHFETSKRIQPSILAASLTYYYLIAFLPFLFFIGQLKKKIFDLPSLILLIIFVSFTIYKMIGALNKILNILYHYDSNQLKIKIRSYLLGIGVLLFVILKEFIVIKLRILTNNLMNTLFFEIIHFVFTFFFANVLLAFVIKVIHPDNKNHRLFLLSLFFTSLSMLLSTFYYRFLFKEDSLMHYLYGSLYPLLISLSLMYLSFQILIHLFIFEYWMNKK